MKLYLVKMTAREGGETFYKIGVTNFSDVMHRFTKYGDESQRIHTGSRRRMEKVLAAFRGQIFEHPYSISVVLEVKFKAEEDAKAIEAEILQAVSGYSYRPNIPFPGATECFTANASQIETLTEYMVGEAADADRVDSGDKT